VLSFLVLSSRSEFSSRLAIIRSRRITILQYVKGIKGLAENQLGLLDCTHSNAPPGMCSTGPRGGPVKIVLSALFCPQDARLARLIIWTSKSTSPMSTGRPSA
jgi:hypothetical protein